MITKVLRFLRISRKRIHPLKLPTSLNGQQEALKSIKHLISLNKSVNAMKDNFKH